MVPWHEVAGGPVEVHLAHGAGNASREDLAVLSCQSTRSEEMAAFDALPRDLRDALNDGVSAWSAVNVLARWRRAASVYGERRATQAGVAMLKAADRRLVELLGG